MVFFDDYAYTFTAHGSIEVLAVEVGTKVKMLRFIGNILLRHVEMVILPYGSRPKKQRYSPQL